MRDDGLTSSFWEALLHTIMLSQWGHTQPAACSMLPGAQHHVCGRAQVGCADILGRIVEDLKDESEPYRRMVMETIDKVVSDLGTADVDARLEELLIDGILYAFQEQVGGGVKQPCMMWQVKISAALRDMLQLEACLREKVLQRHAYGLHLWPTLMCSFVDVVHEASVLC